MIYLPALVPRSVVGKVVPDPAVDLAEGHLPAGVAHGQANEGGVGVERLPLAVPPVVHLERHAPVVLDQLVHVDLLSRESRIVTLLSRVLSQVRRLALIRKTRGFGFGANMMQEKAKTRLRDSCRQGKGRRSRNLAFAFSCMSEK